MVCVSRTNIDLDDDALSDVMRTYGFATKRDAVNFALNRARRHPLALSEALALQGSGTWVGDLEALKASRVSTLDADTAQQ